MKPNASGVPQWQKFLLAGLVLVLVAILAGKFNMGFFLKDYFAAKKQYWTVSNNLETGKHLLADQAAIDGQYQKATTSFYENIPSDLQVPEFLQNLSAHLCRISSIQPLKDKDLGIYTEKSYQVQMQGSLAGFMGFLKSMQLSRFKGQIQNLQIRSAGSGNYSFQYQFICLVSPQGRLTKLFQSVAIEATEPLPKLSGFWVAGEQEKALINGKLVGKGDYLGSYLVSMVDAKAEKVVLLQGHKTVVLRK
jgi:hypothetical protein